MQSFQENVAKLDAGDTQVLGVSMDRYGFFAEDNREIFDICSDLYLFIGMSSSPCE